MNTKPLNNKQKTESFLKGKKWTRAAIASALASGAITAEAAKLYYSQIEDGRDEEIDSDNVAEDQSIPEAEPEPVMESIPEPEIQADVNSVYESEPMPVSETEDNTDLTYEDPEPRAEEDDIVDVIVEEIDPHDIDMEDILLIDDFGTVYTVEGDELNAALIHDSQGNEAFMLDIDGDNVYDIITTPEGDVIAQVPGDIDVSDVEILYAQQHGYNGYIEQNDFDIAMNEEHDSIQDDISLT